LINVKRHDLCLRISISIKQAMKNIKTISLILALPLVLISFAQCASNKSFKLQKTAPFTIKQAISQNYLGGRQGNKGEKITIALSDSDIVLDSLFYKNSTLKLQHNAEGNFTCKLSFSTGKHYTMHENPQEEYDNKAPIVNANFPFKLKGNEAVVSYLKNDITYYYNIGSLTKGEVIIYP